MDQWNFVMHPVYAAKSCDPEGEFVRMWCPELAKVSAFEVHIYTTLSDSHRL